MLNLNMQTILIVEDKKSMASMLKETLESEGYRALISSRAKDGIRLINEESVDMVLTDLKLPGRDGIEVLRASKEENPLRPVIVMTAFGSVNTAVKAMKHGAYDFITKPFDMDHLLMLIKRALDAQRLLTENMLLREEFSSRLGLPEIIGKSEKMLEVANNIQKAAPAKTTILLLGESGTGKELFARAIHHLSGREEYPFVPINCSAIPVELLESELFGYEKGAFSGAESRKPGKFELANKGTLFLDEVGEMGTGLQSKLLRFLQEGEIERIGGTRTIKLDVRIVAASNRDLEKAIAEGEFREDLFYRLNVFPIRIPPLRERKGDIPLLVEYFISKYSSELASDVKDISENALRLLESYSWKGNVRELENTIERAIILCDAQNIRPEHLAPSSLNITRLLNDIPMDGTLDEISRKAARIVETERIKKALEDVSGNKTKAAEQLKVSYKTLLTKIKEYGIQ
jgi:DNA-binding NtrC family response regulator